jgi:hypothetical protein
MVIVRMESGRRAQAATVEKLRTALDEHGVVFIGAIEPFTEATVALRFGAKAPPAVTDADDDSIDSRDALRGDWADEGKWSRLSPSAEGRSPRPSTCRLSPMNKDGTLDRHLGAIRPSRSVGITRVQFGRILRRLR